MAIDPMIAAAQPNELRLDIPFTQYLLPDGRKRAVEFSVSGEEAIIARRVLDKGLRFEAEVLTTGEVSLTIFDPEKEEDVAIEVVPNGPEVPKAVSALVMAMQEQSDEAD